MNKRNYQRELDQLLEHTQKEEKVPRLFLHSCCAPCSSYVLEYLSQYFEITVFFYNPNISLEEEYRKRVAEIQRLVAEMSFTHPVHIMEGTYDPQIFYEMARGLEKIPEGGERCFKCYRLRMEEAAKLAKEGEIEEQMMYNTFNMGLGMVLAVDPADVDKTMDAIREAGDQPYVVGKIEAGEKGVTLC